jgi:hypothetical protein
MRGPRLHALQIIETPLGELPQCRAERYHIQADLIWCGSPLNTESHINLAMVDGPSHGLINYKDPKTKCRLYWCLIEIIDWRYSQLCWYFRLAL